MKLFLLLLALPLAAADLHTASRIALPAAAAADIASSWGKRELNPLFRKADGTFAARRAIIVNGGLCLGQELLQRRLVKRWPTLRPFLTKVNFSFAAGRFALAERNRRIPR